MEKISSFKCNENIEKISKIHNSDYISIYKKNLGIVILRPSIDKAGKYIKFIEFSGNDSFKNDLFLFKDQFYLAKIKGGFALIAHTYKEDLKNLRIT